MIAFCKDSIVVLASKTQIDFLRQAESAAADDSDVPSFEFLLRDEVADVLGLVVFINKADICIGQSTS